MFEVDGPRFTPSLESLEARNPLLKVRYFP
jgi:hypothetical protein